MRTATPTSALTNILWEKYGSARGSLDKALELSPNNARALYYMALVERRDRHTRWQEVADLQKVVEQYPQSRGRAARTGRSPTINVQTGYEEARHSSKRCRRSIPTIWPRTTICPALSRVWG